MILAKLVIKRPVQDPLGLKEPLRGGGEGEIDRFWAWPSTFQVSQALWGPGIGPGRAVPVAQMAIAGPFRGAVGLDEPLLGSDGLEIDRSGPGQAPVGRSLPPP